MQHINVAWQICDGALRCQNSLGILGRMRGRILNFMQFRHVIRRDVANANLAHQELQKKTLPQLFEDKLCTFHTALGVYRHELKIQLAISVILTMTSNSEAEFAELKLQMDEHSSEAKYKM